MEVQGSRRQDDWFGTLLDEVREHLLSPGSGYVNQRV